jgi:hypothetical protein
LLHELCAFGSNTTTLKLALRVHNSIKPYIQSESVTAKTIQTSSETQSTSMSSRPNLSTPPDENSYHLILTLPNLGTDTTFPDLDLSLSTFIRLSPKTIVKVFTALLLERKILIVSQRGITAIVHTCEAFLRFLVLFSFMNTLTHSHTYTLSLSLSVSVSLFSL